LLSQQKITHGMAIFTMFVCDYSVGSPATAKVWHAPLTSAGQHMIDCGMVKLTQRTHFGHSKVKTVLVTIKVQLISFFSCDVKNLVQV
jgi:hypothetical protein